MFKRCIDVNSLEIHYKFMDINDTLLYTRQTKFLKKYIDTLDYTYDRPNIYFNRVKASEDQANGIIDKGNGNSMFTSLYNALKDRMPRALKFNNVNDFAWYAKFSNENALDYGGPFRESIDNICKELTNGVLTLLVPTENQ